MKVIAGLVRRLPSLELRGSSHVLPRGVKPRKGRQLDALLDGIEDMATRAARIVDVGAGNGHFSHLAAARFRADVVGLDRDPARVATARGEATTARSWPTTPAGSPWRSSPPTSRSGCTPAARSAIG